MDRICPSCGTDAGGSLFCPSCGRGLARLDRPTAPMDGRGLALGAAVVVIALTVAIITFAGTGERSMLVLGGPAVWGLWKVGRSIGWL